MFTAQNDIDSLDEEDIIRLIEGNEVPDDDDDVMINRSDIEDDKSNLQEGSSALFNFDRRRIIRRRIIRRRILRRRILSRPIFRRRINVGISVRRRLTRLGRVIDRIRFR